MLYLTKRDPDQKFWGYVAGDRTDVPYVLTELAITDKRVPISHYDARQVFDYLHEQGFRDDETPNLLTPVAVVDADGNCVQP